MTGWIKMGTGLRDHPKVVRMARTMAGGNPDKPVTKQDRMKVVGALHAVWSVFDEHSPDGLLDGYTLAIMDEEIGWKGFSRAMASVGWLLEDDDGLQAPDYEEHNGSTAKRRAQDTKSKGSRRSGKSPPEIRNGVGQMSASDADKVRTRGRGREEGEENSLGTEESSPPVVTPAGAICRGLRQAGIPANPSHTTLLELIAAGATPQHFADAAPKAAGKRDPFAYLLGVVRGQIADAAAVRQQVGGQDASGQDAADWRETKGGVNGRAVELGLSTWDECEPWPDFKRRIVAEDARRAGAGKVAA